MGIMETLYFEGLERQDIGEELAVDAGILKRCEWHEFVYQDDWDLERAYRLAAWRFKRGEVPGPFYSQRDVTDAIKAAVEDATLNCPRCEKIRAED
jgi:hypothetical protein